MQIKEFVEKYSGWTEELDRIAEVAIKELDECYLKETARRFAKAQAVFIKNLEENEFELG